MHAMCMQYLYNISAILLYVRFLNLRPIKLKTNLSLVICFYHLNAYGIGMHYKDAVLLLIIGANGECMEDVKLYAKMPCGL